MFIRELTKHVDVDDALNDVVEAKGFWQVEVLLVICFSKASPSLLPIFANAVPRYKCALEEDGESYLASALVSTAKFSKEYRHLKYDEKLDTESCVDGYVYEHMKNQYVGSIFAEWDLGYDSSWKTQGVNIHPYVRNDGRVVGF
nr:solute carrier family 22 [Hymenolepis microstoma]